jgi:hypothetical protein
MFAGIGLVLNTGRKRFFFEKKNQKTLVVWLWLNVTGFVRLVGC